LLCEGGKQTLDNLGGSSGRTRAQNRCAGERAHGDFLALVQSQTHIEFSVDRLSDENLGGVRLGNEAHKA
jgi:hypothetical protein